MPLDQHTPSRPGGKRRLAPWVLLVALAAVAGGWYLYGGQRDGKDQQDRKGQPGVQAQKPGQGGGFKPVVGVSTVRKRDVKVYLSGLGSVNALNTVTVRSRVDGQLMEVRFREGDMVKAGDVLVQVDPRPFQAQLDQAQGQMARDKALLENAKRDMVRYAELVKTDAIARQQLDTQESLVRQYEGAVRTDQGAIDTAKLQLAYSRITAPITGRVGLRLVDAGNMVHATDQTGLVVITQVQPIAVIFTLPEDNLPRVQASMRGGRKLPVEAYDREQKKLLATGELLTLDNQIDQASGTVRLKAQFPNTDLELFPNQFVNARLLVDVVKDALVVPSAAVQRGPQGAQVCVLGPDNTVQIRKVEASDSVEGEVIVRSGLSDGETVVVDGAERLRDGLQVEIKGDGAGKGKAGSAPQGG